MSAALWDQICMTFVVLWVADLVIRTWGPAWQDEWTYWIEPILAVVAFLVAVGGVIYGDWFIVGTYSVVCAGTVWLWWHNDKNNRRRKKALKKLASRVKNMGGRLAVVPVKN